MKISYAYEWLKVGTHNGHEFYLDKGNIQKNSFDNTLIWQMNSFTEDEWNKYDSKPPAKSMIILLEIDCTKIRYRVLYQEAYDNYIGQGKKIFQLDFENMTEDAKKWRYTNNTKLFQNQLVSTYCKIKI